MKETTEKAPALRAEDRPALPGRVVFDPLHPTGDHIPECIKYVREHGYTVIDAAPEMEQWWVDEVIRHRGKTNRNKECTPGYYNFEGEENQRQDGNYNGTFLQYYTHMTELLSGMEKHFLFR